MSALHRLQITTPVPPSSNSAYVNAAEVHRGRDKWLSERGRKAALANQNPGPKKRPVPNLQAIREAKGFTRHSLSKAARLERRTIQDAEEGAHDGHGVVSATRERLALALGVEEESL